MEKLTTTILKSHKIRLNPTPEQEQYFWQAAGVARFAWNWGLAEYNRRSAAGESVTVVGKGATLKSEFIALKSEQFPWASEVSSFTFQGAFADLQKAISRYFDQKKKGNLKPTAGTRPRKDGKPFGWPRFKARDETTPAFYQANICLRFDNYLVKIQKCPGGWVNMAEPLRFDGRVMGARVSYHANKWWLSVYVEVDHEIPEPNGDTVGVDLGIKYLAVTSDGIFYDNPRPLTSAQRKLARLQRSFSRMTKGGENWQKMKQQIANLHFRVANLRNEASHQMTTAIAQQYGIIGVEDLNIKGMLKNKHLSKAISDAALSEKRRQLEYKAGWNGGTVVVIDRWFPSSKRCNGCGESKADLKLSDRQWTCANCGRDNHRDGNASENIRDEAIRLFN